MLSAEDNEILTRVGPGTPMGELLRRYWMPAALSSELPEPDCDPVKVRLMCEDLVAFRDSDGKVGLVAENCPHRGASMFYGRNEECGLRCVYHGWKFDTEGDCVDMPSEPPASNFKNKVTIPSYPTYESGGIVWTYMGPKETMTPFRDFGSESLPADKVFATRGHRNCNWIQAMEGNLDSAHISWLHQFKGVDDIPDDGTDKPGYPSNAMSWKFWRHDRAPRIEVDETWYGYRYAGIRTTPNGNTHVRISAYCIPNETIIAIIPFDQRLSVIAPVDDTHCWGYALTTQQLTNTRGYGSDPQFAITPYERPLAVPGVRRREFTAENDYQIDRRVQREETFTGIRDFIAQDLMATESMGGVYDRTREHLGTTDKAIIRMRAMLVSAAKKLAADPSWTPPALTADDRDFRTIRSGEKILEPGEDWRIVATDDDPVVQEALQAARGQVTS